MSDEVKEGVEAEESQAAAPAAETEQVQDERQESQSERRKRNDAEYNWAEARRKMQELERQNQELHDRVAQIAQPKSPPQEEDYGIDDSAIAEGRHVKELKRELKQLKEAIAKKDASTVDERIQMRFPDYAEVVSKENIELLKQTEPELAKSLYYVTDPYDQAAAAYKMLKKIQNKQEPSHALEKKKAQENSQKPVSVQAVNKASAIGNAHLFENGLTKEAKAQLWEEMKSAMKYA